MTKVGCFGVLVQVWVFKVSIGFGCLGFRLMGLGVGSI